MKKVALIFLFFCFANCLISQVGLRVEHSSFSVLNQPVALIDFSIPSFIFQNKNNSTPSIFFLKDHLLKRNFDGKNTNGNLPSNKYNNDLAFFCRVELKLEKSSKLPVRFRLGEVQHVDRKEGKWRNVLPDY